LIANSFGFKPQAYFGIEDPAAFEPVAVSSTSSQPQPEAPQTLKLNVEEKEKKPLKQAGTFHRSPTQYRKMAGG